LRKSRLADPCVFKYHFTNITLGMRAKISIVFLSISLIASFGLTSNQAFAGFTERTCAECVDNFDDCIEDGVDDPELCQILLELCLGLIECSAVGGDFIGVETTSVLAAGAQYTAAWMIPVIVSAIGIGIVIARKL